MTAIAGPVSLIASVLGSAVSGIAAYGSAQAQAQIAKQNALVQQQEAARARVEGQIAAQTEGLKGRALLGQILAQQGASGIDISGRSPTDVRSGTAMLNRLDQLTQVSNAEHKAYGHELNAWNYTNEAEAKRRSAQFGIASSILGGASQLSNNWLRLKNPQFGSSLIS